MTTTNAGNSAFITCCVAFLLLEGCETPSKSKQILGSWIVDSIFVSSTQSPIIEVVRQDQLSVATGSIKKPRIIVFRDDQLYFDTLFRSQNAFRWALIGDSQLHLQSFATSQRHYGFDIIRRLDDDRMEITEIVKIYVPELSLLEGLDELLPVIKSHDQNSNSVKQTNLPPDFAKILNEREARKSAVSENHSDSLLKNESDSFTNLTNPNAGKISHTALDQIIAAVRHDSEDTILELNTGYFDRPKNIHSTIIFKKVKFLRRLRP